MDEWINIDGEEGMAGWVDRWIGRMDGWIDGWVGGEM